MDTKVQCSFCSDLADPDYDYYWFEISPRGEFVWLHFCHSCYIRETTRAHQDDEQEEL